MADKTEFLQAIDDAILDADSLERFINGADTQDVLTRLSAEYPTLQKAIKIMFENGGLPAIPFKTKTEMESSNLEDGSYAIVTADGVNNGLYEVSGSSVVRSRFDWLLNSREYTDKKTKPIENMQSDFGDMLFVKSDAVGRVVEYTDKDGGLYLTELNGSVQDNINLAISTTRKYADAIDTDCQDATHAFLDKKDRVMAAIKSDGGLLLTNIDGSVQDNIESLHRDITDLLSILTTTEPPAPIGSTRGDYTVSSLDILNLSLTKENETTVINMDSPYRKNDRFVHPDVIELPKPFRGYKYLLCITPYNEANIFEENPTIYGSNNGHKWDMLKGVEQPIDNPPHIDEPDAENTGYLSDNWWSYDPVNQELLCCYRKNYFTNGNMTYGTKDRVELLYRSTKDGLTWDEPKQLVNKTTMDVNKLISPTMFYDDELSKWVLIYMELDRWVVLFNDSLDADTWSEPTDTGIMQFYSQRGLDAWHTGGKFIGNDFYLIMSSRTGNRAFHMLRAKDKSYSSWDCSTVSVLGEQGGVDAYKASFMPIIDDDSLKLSFYWTDRPGDMLKTATSNYISIFKK